MDYDFSWLAEAGLDTGTGLDYTGGKEKYLSALQRFFKSHEKNRARVLDYFESKDWENYRITVHALKSNAKMIGATDLSKAFEALETAAASGDTAAIERDHAPVIEAYDHLAEVLKPIGEMGDVRAADEISAEVARETADKLLAALDDFDDELSKELATKLSGYPFRITQRDRLKEAAGLIEDFMYDEAAEIIREIVPAIE
ncbi:MAG: Hpt domain-containing protein [Lachnospiraceae bacterium]|nr:Hpt domain-containing protein [Lachnospiraceae bacterium]